GDSIEENLTRIRSHGAGEHLNEGALPGAVFSAERVDLSGANFQVDITERPNSRIVLHDPAQQHARRFRRVGSGHGHDRTVPLCAEGLGTGPHTEGRRRAGLFSGAGRILVFLGTLPRLGSALAFLARGVFVGNRYGTTSSSVSTGSKVMSAFTSAGSSMR